jgi:hypothetical protein
VRGTELSPVAKMELLFSGLIVGKEVDDRIISRRDASFYYQ